MCVRVNVRLAQRGNSERRPVAVGLCVLGRRSAAVFRALIIKFWKLEFHVCMLNTRPEGLYHR